MQEILIPRRALVVICGPSCSGKSTLTRRVMAESPQTDKYLYTLDNEYVAAMRKIPELQSYADSVAAGKPFNENILSRELALRLLRERSGRLASVLMQHQFVVYDGILLSREALQQQLLSMHFAYGVRNPCSPLVLIKMLPSEELHRQFYLERQKMPGGGCLPADYVRSQRAKFAAQIATYNFTDELQSERDCYEYTVTDPRAVVIVKP